MPKTKAQNLTQINETLSGKEIEVLNGLEPGLGSKMHLLFSKIGNVLGAQAGHSGTVVIAEQKKNDPRGVPLPAMKLQGQRTADAGDAIDDQDYVTLKQVRTLLAEKEEDAADLLDDVIAPKPACARTVLSNPKSIDTGLSTLHAVEALNEFVFVLGVD